MPAKLPTRLQIVTAIGVVILLATASARAGTKSWVVTSSTSWSNPANWSPTGVPGSGDNAVLNTYTSNGLSFNTIYDYTGAPVSLQYFYLSADSDHNTGATATLTMNAGSLTASDEAVGGYQSFSSGTHYGNGVFVQSGGVNSTGALFLGTQGYGAGTYTLNNGTLAVSGEEFIGLNIAGATPLDGAGTIMQNGGTNATAAISCGGFYGLAGGTLSAGTEDFGGPFVQSGGSNTAGTLTFEGTGSISGGSSAATASTTVGAVVASVDAFGVTGFTFVPGTLAIRNTGHFTTPVLTIAPAGDVELSGGTLSIGSLSIQSGTDSNKFSSTGVFNWTGGVFDLAGSVIFDPQGSGMGTFFGSSLTLDNNKTLQIDSVETLGGTGSFTLTLNAGGGNSTIALDVATNGKMFVTGGTLTANTINLHGDPSRISWSSGTLSLTSAITFDPTRASTATSTIFGSQLTLSGSKTLVETSETLTSSLPATPFVLTINPGGANLLSSKLTVGVNGSLTIAGGTLAANSVAVSSGKLLFSSGTFNPGTLAFASSASGTFSAQNQTLTFTALSVDATSKLDAGKNSFIIHNGDLNALRTALQAGYNNGGWNGATGIRDSAITPNSITGLGYAVNADSQGIALFSTFGGRSVSTTDTLMKVTYFGDADLNGKINANDYGLIDSGYQNQHTAGFVDDWYNGDFNYDGKIDANDYALIDASYQLQSGTLRMAVDYLETGDTPTGLISSSLQEVINHNNEFGAAYANDFIFATVPEPASLVPLCLAVAAMRRRR